jgi:hypothetical protein
MRRFFRNQLGFLLFGALLVVADPVSAEPTDPCDQLVRELGEPVSSFCQISDEISPFGMDADGYDSAGFQPNVAALWATSLLLSIPSIPLS